MASSIWRSFGLREPLEDTPKSQLATEAAVGPLRGRGKRAGKLPLCCLCGKEMSPGGIVIEERPTAEDGSFEKWYYCPRCWVELRKLREPPQDRKHLLKSAESPLDVAE